MRRLPLVLLMLTLPLFAQQPEWRRLTREAVDAYKAGNFALFLEKSRAAAASRPEQPLLLYNVAAGLALNGRADEAMDVLTRIAATGLVSEPGRDDDFASIRSLPRFTGIVNAFHRNGEPIGKTARAFTIDRKGIISEGIAYDAKTKRTFVSSVRNGAIYAIDGNGRVSTFVDDQRWGVFGMAIDSSRRILWATTSALPQNKQYRAEDKGRAGVLQIDLDRGSVLRTFEAPAGKPHTFGDLTVAADGTVYVSDSVSPSIFVIAKGSIAPFIESGPFGSLQGLALSRNGRTLYAADYGKGIHAIDLATRDSHVLTAPRDTALLGIDGLYTSSDGSLIATQNGTNPQRVLRLKLARDNASIASVDVLAANQPDFDDITLGTLAGDRLLFNAAAQWNLFDDNGSAPDASKLKPAVVLSVRTR
jgi:sugar lactone lactonase YvrE